MKKGWICDIETLSNCIIFCFLDYGRTDEKHHFVIWKDKNDFSALYSFLRENIADQARHVTYNGLAFDSQIIQWILDREDHFTDARNETSDLASEIYKYAQYCINKSNNGEWQDYAPWQLQIPQLDLMKMGHWDAISAKSASLKWLQCAIDWPNVEDMPYQHTFYVETQKQVDEITSYCYNDCEATKKVLYISKDAVRLRKDLSEEYRMDLWSASEPRMAKELFLHFLSQKMGVEKRDLKKYNTFRDNINIKDVILPYVKFEKQEFNMLLNNFKTLTVQGDALKGAFKYNVKYRGMSIDYGMGGIHGATASGVYNSSDDFFIKSVDVSSFYPNMAIYNKWSPAHINKKAFCEQYLWFYDERKKHAKGSAKNKALKLLLNSTFGLSIDKNSFLSDPMLGVTITVNGQLLLTMLLEMLCERIEGAKPLVMNTDGIEIMIHKDQESAFQEVCKEWEKITQLTLEYDKFKTILSYDCNNYLSLFENGKLKGKGRFEYEPHDKYDLDVLHKNKSFLVIPKGIAAYFFKGTKPEEFVQNHTNIFDFCGFARARGKWKFIQFTGTAEGVSQKEIQKTLRYYVSKRGSKIVKHKKEIVEVIDGHGNKKEELKESTIQVLAGRMHLTEFNKFQEKGWSEYDIDYGYYVKEIYREIRNLEKPQLELFTNEIEMDENNF